MTPGGAIHHYPRQGSDEAWRVVVLCLSPSVVLTTPPLCLAKPTGRPWDKHHDGHLQGKSEAREGIGRVLVVMAKNYYYWHFQHHNASVGDQHKHGMGLAWNLQRRTHVWQRVECPRRGIVYQSMPGYVSVRVANQGQKDKHAREEKGAAVCARVICYVRPRGMHLPGG